MGQTSERDRKALYDYIAVSTAAISKIVHRSTQTPDECRAALAEFFSDPAVQARVREQIDACAAAGHTGHCPLCAPET